MSDSPQSTTIIKGLVGAFIAAMLATVLLIMPAEFGRDPTGVGGLLGLTGLAETEAGIAQPKALAMDGAFPAIVADFDEYEPPVIGLPFANIIDDIDMQRDDITITLEAGEQVEYKAIMNRGDSLVYAWTSDAEEIYSDFHADPTEDIELYPDGYFVRYQESEEPGSKGSLVAPFTGNHGWYWLNYNEVPVTIELTVRGYYTEIHELGRSFQ